MNKSLYGFKIDKILMYNQIKTEHTGFLLFVTQDNNIPQLCQTPIHLIQTITNC